MTSAIIQHVTADPRLRARVRDLMEPLGIRVLEAPADGDLLVTSEPPDLVLLDTRVPDHDAATLVRRLAAGVRPVPPVLVLAPRSDAESALAAVQAGADDVLFEPIDAWSLPARVLGLLARGRLDGAREHAKTLEFRNQELESFIYIVTHDMKSPVVNLQGLVGLIEQDHRGALPAQVLDYLGRLRRNAERLESLLRDLLEYPRRLRIVGPIEPHALGPIATRAVEGLTELAAASGASITVAPDLPTVRCDPKRLQQVFHNLVENALKHGDHGARVEVGWEDVAGGPRMHVRDDGPGIPAEHLDDIFRLFHRLEGAGDGTGLGLAVARQLVEAHGGEIWCESTPGKGAAFYFTIGR